MPRLFIFPMLPLVKTVPSPLSLKCSFLFPVLTFVQSAAVLMYRLKMLKTKDVSVSNYISCDAAHQSACFASYSRWFPNWFKVLITLSNILFSPPSIITNVSAARLEKHLPARLGLLLPHPALFTTNHNSVSLFQRILNLYLSTEFFVPTFQLISTEVEALLWCDCEWRIRVTILITLAAHSCILCGLVQLIDGKANDYLHTSIPLID